MKTMLTLEQIKDNLEFIADNLCDPAPILRCLFFNTALSNVVLNDDNYHQLFSETTTPIESKNDSGIFLKIETQLTLADIRYNANLILNFDDSIPIEKKKILFEWTQTRCLSTKLSPKFLNSSL